MEKMILSKITKLAFLKHKENMILIGISTLTPSSFYRENLESINFFDYRKNYALFSLVILPCQSCFKACLYLELGRFQCCFCPIRVKF